MRFFRPTILTVIPPALVLLSTIFWVEDLEYRMLTFTIPAIPLWPLIDRLGWVYRDKPMFLTPEAARLVGVIWAVAIYLYLCAVRRWPKPKECGDSKKLNPTT